ncbi:MAG: hypothetical protein K2X03_15895 [Bryobacteraceae bacterium]|nr:hypothetical protein [Bryobacteraceae bacterium]
MLVDAFSFYIVILLLSLAEGFLRLDPPSVLWLDAARGLRLRRPFDYPASGKWGWLFRMPFWPAHEYVTHLPPFAVDGHWVVSASTDFVLGRPAPLRLALDRLGPLATDGPYLLLGTVRLRCQSPPQAHRMSQWLGVLKSLNPQARQEEIRRTLTHACDAHAATGARATVAAKLKPLRRLGLLLQGLLLLGFPIIAMTAGLTAAVVVCGAIALILSAAIAWKHRRLAASSWADFLRLALYPIGAVHAAAGISQEALSDFHPVAFGAQLVGAREYRRTTYWLPGEDPAAEETRRWFYQELRLAIEQSLRVQKIVIPAPTFSAGTRSYCPRCCAEYTFPNGPCPDCPGRHVLPI